VAVSRGESERLAAVARVKNVDGVRQLQDDLQCGQVFQNEQALKDHEIECQRRPQRPQPRSQDR
jgi:hypothetical protein